MKNLNTKVSLFLFIWIPSSTMAASNTDPKLIENQRDGSILEFLERIQGFLLGITGGLAVLFIVLGGVQYITSGGNTQKADTAKKTVTYAIYGLLFVILANVILGLVSGNLLGGIFGNDAANL